MQHSEQELNALKTEVCKMGNLVLTQLLHTRQSLLHGDIDVANTIIERERRVNACELHIDRQVENYIALHTPVAIDLRLALSLIRISLTLERIGDFAAGIAQYVLHAPQKIYSLMEGLQVEKMLSTAIDMLTESLKAFDTGDATRATEILAMDETLDSIYKQSFSKLSAAAEEGGISLEESLRLIVVLRKIERIGDHCSNMAEEAVFYIDAKVLKHSSLSSQ